MTLAIAIAAATWGIPAWGGPSRAQAQGEPVSDATAAAETTAAAAAEATAAEATAAEATGAEATGAEGAEAEGAEAAMPDAPTSTAPVVETSAASRAERLRALIDEGGALFSRRDFVGASQRFEQALGATDDPEVMAALHYNLAVCLERAGALDRSIASWRTYASASATDTDRAEAEQAIADLTARAGRVAIRTGVPADVYLDEVLVGRAPGTFLVLPAEAVTLALRAEGYAHAHRTVTVVAGADVSLEVALVPESEALREAGARITRGEALFADGSYDAALAEFEAAHALLEGGGDMYLALYNVALCHQRLGRVDLAVRYYEQYLAAAPVAEPGRADVETTVATLRDLLGTLVLETNVDAEVWVDGRLLGTAPGEVRIAGGLHDVELRAPGVETARFPLQVAAGQRIEREVELAILPEGGGLGPEAFVATTAVTGVALIAGAALGGVALALEAQITQRGPDGNTEEELAQREAVAIGADVSFAVAGAAGIAAIILGVSTDWDGGGPARQTRDVPLAMIPWIGPQVVGASVVGAF